MFVREGKGFEGEAGPQVADAEPPKKSLNAKKPSVNLFPPERDFSDLSGLALVSFKLDTQAEDSTS